MVRSLFGKKMSNSNNYILKTVRIGNVEIGENNHITIQSMTNTNTLNTIETVDQIIKIVDAGADIVRVSTPTIKDAENLKNIKDLLSERGYNIPLVADIHFNPKIAEIAAKVVEKIRINPGNFADKKSKHEDELENIKKSFIPLIKICKKYNTAIRIGVNHGSLSPRILDKYGDTPAGMVESAMEYIKICQEEGFHNIVLSLKSSNTRIMVYSNRLMYESMKDSGIVYPLHIGVTEAGSGEDGRLKSAVGIGALLSDGIGDTIRVSLTESPDMEIPVAKKIIQYSDNSKNSNFKSALDYFRRKTYKVGEIGGNNQYAVITRSVTEIRYNSSIIEEYIYLDTNTNSRYPVFEFEDFLLATDKSKILNFVTIRAKVFSQNHIDKLKELNNVAIILSSYGYDGIDEYYNSFDLIMQNNLETPVVIKRTYFEDQIEDLQIESATELGGLLIDGYGEGLWLESEVDFPQSKLSEYAFGLLQASRLRFTKPEYISCPTCSRTLFDIEKICEEIKKRTSNIKNIKIAIMGCIVNGPGEMADADYGYVGSGVGKVTLYKGKEIVKRNIPQDEAIEELIKIINSDS